MADDDVYAAERARLADERSKEKMRQREADRKEADKARLEAIAQNEVHSIAVRAWQELQAAGIRPVRFVTSHYSGWSGKSTWRSVRAPGQYWLVNPRGSVLVNEHGMFGHNLSVISEGTPTEPAIWCSGEDPLRPIKVGEFYDHVNADWDSPAKDYWITANEDGRAMADYNLLLEVAVARDVVAQIEAVRSR